MLKDYLKTKGTSIYALSKKIGVAYSTLNDLANGKVDVDNCRLGFIKALSDELRLSIDELYEICSNKKEIFIDSQKEPVEISVRNKNYHARFSYNDEIVDLPLCQVNEDSTEFILDLAEWRVKDYIENRQFEELVDASLGMVDA